MKEAFEKILERLEAAKDIPHDDSVAEAVSTGIWNKAIQRAKGIVQEVAKKSVHNTNVRESEWIPCSERLPDKAGYEVLATLENSFGQRRVTIIFTGYGDESFWHCNNKEYDLEVWKVIAWQSLPEPYELT